MKAQVIGTRFVKVDENGDRTKYDQGSTVEVSREVFDRFAAEGMLREPSDAPLPEPNAGSAPPALTQPDGTPIENVTTATVEGFKTPRSHAEADELAARYGVTFPENTKLDAKADALRAVAAAQAAGEPPPPAPVSTENIADLDDGELIQRGVDFGLDEEQMVDKSHDELVLIVAEAMNRQGQTEQAQRASVEERAPEPS